MSRVRGISIAPSIVPFAVSPGWRTSIELHVVVGRQPLLELADVDARAALDLVRMLLEHAQRVGEVADDAVEADARQAVLGLHLQAVVGDEHDRRARLDDAAGVLGVAARRGRR